jgi:hypothetical protein
MALNLVDLDSETRKHMLAELDEDVARGRLYLSPRLNERGLREYAAMLRAAIETGNDETLAVALIREDAISAYEVSHRRGRPFRKRVPHDAHLTLAEGEFNRFYLRGLCQSVLAMGGTHVQLYRARASSRPRAGSAEREGSLLEAKALLDDLRQSVGYDTALGLPPGPNSGLSARHPLPIN